jgi:preprotein translocase subunit SecG
LPAVRTVALWFSGILNVASVMALVGSVLLHSGRGGGLSDMFGGASSAALGSTSAERNLNRITTIVALIWVFTILTLGLLMD